MLKIWIWWVATSSMYIAVAYPASAAQTVVTTVAGPGFCAGPAIRDPEHAEVRTLAVDQMGTLFFETGPPASGVVGRVDSDGRATRLVTGPLTSPEPRGPRHGGTGRFVPDGKGGIILAAGRGIVNLDSRNGLSAVAGKAFTDESRSEIGVGDGGPALEARFSSIHGLAGDHANVYVAEEVDSRQGTFRIRFINRGSQPVLFYPGTDSEITIQPGHIDTIIGERVTDNSADSAGAGGFRGPGDSSVSERHVRHNLLSSSPPVMASAPDRLYLGLSDRRGKQGQRYRLAMVNLKHETVNIHGRAIRPGTVDTIAPAGWGTKAETAAKTGKVFLHVSGISTDPDKNLLIADSQTHRVFRLDASGRLSSLAGTGKAGNSGDYGPARKALLNHPVDVDAGPGGRIFISDGSNGRIRMVAPSGTIHPWPGSGVLGPWRCTAKSESIPLSEAEMLQQGGPAAVVTDSRGNVYFSTVFGHQIKKLDPSGKITNIAGAVGGSCGPARACPAFSGDGGRADGARLAFPTALAMDAQGGLYVLDAGNARVRLINLGSRPRNVHGVRVAPGQVETVAGNGNPGSSGDGGPALEAQLGTLSRQSLESLRTNLSFPLTLSFSLDLALGSLAADGDGNLLIASGGFLSYQYGRPVEDAGNDSVRIVDKAGKITTFAGKGAPARRAECCRDPAGLAIDAKGNLYVTDRGAQPPGPPQPGVLAANRDPSRKPKVWMINRTQRTISAFGQTLEAGQATVIAGNGGFGFGGDGGNAAEAQLLVPAGITVDGRGGIFFAEYGNSETGDIRRIDPGGTISRKIGNGQAGFNGDRLSGLQTSLFYPVSLSVDGCSLYLADLGNDRVRQADLSPECPASRSVDSAADTPRVERWIAPGLAWIGALIALSLIKRRIRAG